MQIQISTDKLLDEYLAKSHDDSAQNIANGKIKLQYYYLNAQSAAGNMQIEKTKYTTTEENQRSYLLHPDYIQMKSMAITVGGIKYPITEEPNPELWARRVSITNTSTIPTHYAIFNQNGAKHFELDPVPSANGSAYNLELIYDGYLDPLSFPDEYTGNATAVAGSENWVGSATSFTAAMIGRFICVTAGMFWYEIAGVTDATHLSTVGSFQEASVSAQPFIIGELLRISPEYNLLPVWGALMDYYSDRDMKKSQMYLGMYKGGIADIRAKYANKTKGNVFPGRRFGTNLPNGYVPRNYPTGLVGPLV